MAASAGGVTAFESVLAALPDDFPLPIAIVQHRSTRDPNLMARVLARAGRARPQLTSRGAQLFGWQARQWRAPGYSSSQVYGISAPQVSHTP